MGSQRHISRRNFLGASATSLGATAVYHAAQKPALAADTNDQQDTASVSEWLDSTVAFDGQHQAGIATPSQTHLNLIAFDIRSGVDVAGVQRLMRLWTEDARRLCAGENPLGSLEPEMVETPARLTITCGVGQRFFDIIGAPEQCPSWLEPLPEFSLDQLQSRWAGGDLVLQICCDDPLYLAFATRHMIRAGIDYVQQRWRQTGFLPIGPASSGKTPRNLFGQKDGTINPRSKSEFDEQVWIQQGDDSPEWLVAGTCMVVRRIHMHLDTWEMLDRFSREVTVGRTLDTGAPLGQEDEFDEADYALRDATGLPYIDAHSHMALAAPAQGTDRLLRRAYSYDEPLEDDTRESSNAGLIFICFQRDPRAQFVPIQERLDAGDRMNEWITHIGSEVFAMVPGTNPDSKNQRYWAQQLLESVVNR